MRYKYLKGETISTSTFQKGSGGNKKPVFSWIKKAVLQGR